MTPKRALLVLLAKSDILVALVILVVLDLLALMAKTDLTALLVSPAPLVIRDLLAKTECKDLLAAMAKTEKTDCKDLMELKANVETTAKTVNLVPLASTAIKELLAKTEFVVPKARKDIPKSESKVSTARTAKSELMVALVLKAPLDSMANLEQLV